jgi:death-on-curing protein
MTSSILTPPIEAVLDAYHREMLETGGAAGIRDRGRLEAAMARADSKLAYATPRPDIHDVASAIAFGVAKNHPFVDGNKRMAFITAFMTLRINGWYLDATERDATRAVTGLASGSLDEAAFAAWLRDKSYAL